MVGGWGEYSSFLDSLTFFFSVVGMLEETSIFVGFRITIRILFWFKYDNSPFLHYPLVPSFRKISIDTYSVIVYII